MDERVVSQLRSIGRASSIKMPKGPSRAWTRAGESSRVLACSWHQKSAARRRQLGLGTVANLPYALNAGTFRVRHGLTGPGSAV